MRKPYGIYLSSTLQDLRNERAEVEKLLAKAGFSVKQSYGANENSLIASCLEDVTQCAVYIGIVGMRYGYVPANGGGKSITELEFAQALKNNVAPFVFVKDTGAQYLLDDVDTNHTDVTTGIGKFRVRVSSGTDVRPELFKTVAELGLAVATRIADFQRHIDRGTPILMPMLRNAAELTHDIALVMVPGTDEAAHRRYSALCVDSRFKIVFASPDEPAYLRVVEAETRLCRCVCWVLSPQSIGRFSPELLGRVAKVGRFRHGSAFVMLIDGATPAQLDPAWGFYVVDDAPGVTDGQRLDTAYAAIRAKARQIYPDRRIAIPAIVLALTQAEARALVDDPKKVMRGFDNRDESQIRHQQFGRMRTAVRGRHPGWPEGFYGITREEWRPFGPLQPTAVSLLTRAIDRLNDAARRSGRDRQLLAGEDVKLHVRPYSFDEYVDDSYGTRDNLDGVRDQGCILLVDEMALLEPSLRRWANQFLSGQRAAVVSVNPFDPAFAPIAELLHDSSFLRVGTMRERFRVAQDPRCELAVNCLERLERWLSLVLPELVPTLGQMQPHFAHQSEELFTRAEA